MIHFGVSPSEAWQMTMTEWWSLHDEYAAKNRDPSQPAPLTEDEVAELKELMAAEQAKDRAA